MSRNRVSYSALILFAMLAIGCNSRTDDTWSGTVYPNKNDLTNYLHLGSFQTLEECGAASIIILDKLNSLKRGDYECGRNCQKYKNTDSLVCEETTKAYLPLDEARRSYPNLPVKEALHNLCFYKISKIYDPSYLTLYGMVIPWLVRKMSYIGIPTPEEWKTFTEGKKEFVRIVKILAATSESIYPGLDMGPWAFEARYNFLAEYRKLPYKIQDN